MTEREKFEALRVFRDSGNTERDGKIMIVVMIRYMLHWKREIRREISNKRYRNRERICVLYGNLDNLILKLKQNYLRDICVPRTQADLVLTLLWFVHHLCETHKTYP